MSLIVLPAGIGVWHVSVASTSNSATPAFLPPEATGAASLFGPWHGYPNGPAKTIYLVEYVCTTAGAGSGNGVLTWWLGNPGSEVSQGALVTVPITSLRQTTSISPAASVPAGASVAFKWNASGTVSSGANVAVWSIYWRAA